MIPSVDAKKGDADSRKGGVTKEISIYSFTHSCVRYFSKGFLARHCAGIVRPLRNFQLIGVDRQVIK